MRCKVITLRPKQDLTVTHSKLFVKTASLNKKSCLGEVSETAHDVFVESDAVESDTKKMMGKRQGHWDARVN